ncbi:MAG: hypothetical protein AAF355_12345 [Myxococcota bacterium]
MSFLAQRSIIRTATLFLTASWIIGCGDDGSSTDTTGIEVIVANGGLNTTETGGTASFVIRLLAAPSADVMVPLSSSDETEGLVTPAELTFTIDDWSAPQMVTATGVDDDIQDGTVVYLAQLGAAMSSDENYSGLDAEDVSIENIDDETAGITVSPTSGLTTTEGGGSDTFSIVLNSQPQTDTEVIVAVSSSNPAEGTAVPTSVTFTDENWDSPQVVTVTGQDDGEADGNVVYSIETAPAESGDSNYTGLDAADVEVTNTTRTM